MFKCNLISEQSFGGGVHDPYQCSTIVEVGTLLDESLSGYKTLRNTIDAQFFIDEKIS